MNLRIKPLTKKSKDIDKMIKVYYDSFPKEEQIPVRSLLRKSKKDFIDLLAFYDKDVFIGFTYIVTYQDISLVFYLAIDEKFRSNGYGGAALSTIKKKYPNNRIILNIEAVDENANNYAQRVKRKKFYLKHGYRNLNFKVMEGKVLYEVLITGNNVSFEEYYALSKKFIGPILSWFIKPKRYPAEM